MITAAVVNCNPTLFELNVSKHETSQKKKLLLLATSSLFLSIQQASAELYFDPAMLNMKSLNQPIDISQFNKANSQIPGHYFSEIYINGKLVDSIDLLYTSDDRGLTPCFTLNMLKQYGVKTSLFPALSSLNDEACVDIQAIIPKSQVDVYFGRQVVDVSLPQAVMTHQTRGEVSPERWQDGETALFTDYNISGSRTHHDNADSSSQVYVNARSGFNIGPWRLRNYSTYHNNGNNHGQWDALNTYLQRDIRELRAQLTVGDTYSSSGVFDSLSLRGIEFASDDNMLPDNLRGYAPVIRGIANSNAEVTVRQNGHVIYQTYVTPGAFEITDIYPSATSGDMEISIKEQDGSVHTFTQGFAAVPVLQREGHLKYDLAAGQYRSNGNHNASTPNVMQAAAAYGLPWGLTLYGGVQGANDYHAYAFGIGKNLGLFGAVSTDITHAVTKINNDEKEKGQSFRFLYAKTFADTATTLRLTGYRYSTQGFYSFSEAQERMYDSDSLYTYNKRGRFDISVNQRLANYGSFYASVYDQSYWGGRRSDRTWQTGFNSSWKDINYGISFSSSSSQRYNATNRQIAFNVSLPLERWLTPNSKSNTSASYSINHSNDHQTTQQMGLFGTALDSKLAWNASQAYGNDGVGSSGNLGASYQGTYGEANLGYNYSKQSTQYNYGFRGGVIVHDEGITLSQSLGESMVLIKAANAAGTKLENETGVAIDYRGYAVIPYASAYRENRVALDTTSLPEQVEVDNPVVNIVPTKGALVKVDFNTVKGYRTLMRLTQNGKPLPFGTTIVDDVRQRSSIVGDEGEVFLSGLERKGTLNAKWGEGSEQQCQIHYSLPVNELDNNSVINSYGVCK